MIGVVGADERATGAIDALEEAGASVRTGDAGDVVKADPDAVVAVGETAFVDLVRADVESPVLPVEVDPALPSIPLAALSTVLEALDDGRARTSDRRLIDAVVDGESTGPAAFDVMLVRSDPGRISEYAVEAGDARSAFRADGVVVATPTGSHGYAHAAGGPRLGPDIGAVAVVPVAAFGLGTPVWVLDPDDGVALSVAREQGDISLLLDGRERRTLAGPATVTVRTGGLVRTVSPPGD